MGGRKNKLELVFDEQARREYLTGFTKRKLERRKFGLAMQKVKDHQKKLEERRQVREAKREAMDKSACPLPLEKTQEPVEPAEVLEFHDRFTRQHFGDSVTVTTYLGIPDADEEEEEARQEQDDKPRKKWKNDSQGVDKEQVRAGSLSHFKQVVGANLPSKKKKRTKANTSGSFQPKKKKGGQAAEAVGKGVKGKHRNFKKSNKNR